MDLRVRRMPCLKAENLSAIAGDNLQYRTHGARWAAQAALNLLGVHVQFREGAAQSVAVHAEFFGCLTLVASMTCEYFRDVTLFELAHCIGVRDASGVHLEDEVV